MRVSKAFYIQISVLALISLAFLLYSIHAYPLFSLDEVRYAETAREMIERADYVTPYCNYVLRPEKPILFYWFEILAFKAFGFSEFAARLPSVLMGVFAVIVVFLTAEFFAFGIYAALILLTSIEFAIVSKLSVTDMTLNSLMTACIAALFFVYHFSDFDRNKTRGFLLLAAFFAALGFLAKGPVALVMPALIFFVFLFFKTKLFCFCKGYWREILLALGLFLVVALPWFVAVHLATNGEFTQRFFFQENINRFLAVQTGHSAPWFYYVPVFLVGFIPWTFFAFQALGATVKSVFKSQDKDDYAKRDLLFYSLIWFCVIFVFFSFAQTKLTTYIIGVFPVAALILGAWFAQLEVWKSKNLGIMLGLTLFGISGFVAYCVRLFFKDKLIDLSPNAFANEILLVALVTFFASLLALFFCARHKGKYAFYVIVLSMMFIFSYVTDTIVKPISFYRDSGTREFMRDLKAEDQLVSYGIPPERFEFYAARQVPRYRDKKLKRYLQSGARDKYLVFKTKDLDKLLKLIKQESFSYTIKTNFYSIVKIN